MKPRGSFMFRLLLPLALTICSLNAAELSVPILCYHRIREAPMSATTVTPENFRSQLMTLTENGYRIIPLSDLVAWRLGTGPAPAEHSVVITFDDGHESFYDNAKPILDSLHVPATMFLVTSCISHGTYCVGWDQVASLEKDPLIDLESHTVDHPNFSRQQRRLASASYDQFVDGELAQSKTALETKLSHPVDMLAWPYGIYTPGLLASAAKDGYAIGFSVECRSAALADPKMAMPRCMVLNSDTGDNLLHLLRLADAEAAKGNTERKWRLMPRTDRVLVSKAAR
jgi:peptidoglycan/xylan/chitin deacetylase (PgdA/CDA1 family)